MLCNKLFEPQHVILFWHCSRCSIFANTLTSLIVYLLSQGIPTQSFIRESFPRFLFLTICLNNFIDSPTSSIISSLSGCDSALSQRVPCCCVNKGGDKTAPLYPATCKVIFLLSHRNRTHHIYISAQLSDEGRKLSWATFHSRKEVDYELYYLVFITKWKLLCCPLELSKKAHVWCL